jgi:hypothetical protein
MEMIASPMAPSSAAHQTEQDLTLHALVRSPEPEKVANTLPDEHSQHLGQVVKDVNFTESEDEGAWKQRIGPGSSV